MSEQTNAPEAQFALQRIYVKDASFESPMSPNAFRSAWSPKVNLELNSRHTSLQDDLYEVVLSLTVTTRNEAEEVLYLAEVQQAGIFMLKGFAEDVMGRTLGSFCPNVLFPYAREAIDGFVIRGSFPPLMLAPVNFDALYEQMREQREKQKTTVQ